MDEAAKTPVQRASAVLHKAVEQQANEREEDALVTMWIAARSILRILGPAMARRSQDQ